MNDRIILKSKIVVPEIIANTVPRARLRGALDGAVRKPIVSVVAPAGYGKTTLLASWAHHTHYSVGWYSITANDNDPGRFMSYLIEAFGKDPELRKRCAKLDTSTIDENVLLSLMDALIDVLTTSEQEHILILDDFHHITDGRITMCLEYFIYHMPSTTHLIVSSRSKPDLALSKLRAYGYLDEIDHHELAFTPLEAKELFRRARRKISEVDLRDALTVTEGWVVGLTLLTTARPLKGSIAFDRIRSFSFLDEITDGFFQEEVLDAYDENVREFLFETSLCECFSPELAAVVTELSEGESATHLQTLLDKNPFLFAVEGKEGWFRYHTALRRSLKRRFKTIDPPRAKTTSLRVATWYKEHGMSDKAIEIALENEDYRTAESLIVDNRALLHESDRLNTLLTWIQSLPAYLVQKNPLLCIARALPLGSVAGDILEAENSLRRAEQLISTDDSYSVAEKSLLSGEIAANRAILAAIAGNASQVHHQGHEALELLPPEKGYLRRFVMQSLLWYSNAETDDLRDSFKEALEKSKREGVPTLVLGAMSDLGNYDYRCGRIDQARRMLRDALDMTPTEQHTQHRILTTAYLTLGEIYYLTDQITIAEEHLVKGLEICRKHYIPHEVAHALMTLAKIEDAKGSYATSSDLLDESIDIAPSGFHLSYPSWQQMEHWVASGTIPPFPLKSDSHHDSAVIPGSIWARRDVPLYLEVLNLALSGHIEGAYLLLEKDRSTIEAVDELTCLRFTILHAALLEESGQHQRAEHALEEALTIARKENLIRPFIDEGQRMSPILKRIKIRHADEFMTKLYAACAPDHSRKLKGGHHQPLSTRETEILVMSKNGISTDEIARRLQLSRQTVRTHFANTYSKLEVHSRQQAVCTAEALGLI